MSEMSEMKRQAGFMSIVLLLLAATMPFGDESVNSVGIASAAEPVVMPDVSNVVKLWSNGTDDSDSVSGTIIAPKNVTAIMNATLRNQTPTWFYEKDLVNQSTLFLIRDTGYGFDYKNLSTSKSGYSEFDYSGFNNPTIDTQVAGAKPTEPVVTQTIVFGTASGDGKDSSTQTMRLEDAMSFDPERSVRVVGRVAQIGGVANDVEFPSKVLPEDVLPS